MKKRQGELFERPRPDYLTAFDGSKVSNGRHIFADGASVPNPGLGGWGVVAICNGAEIFSDCGGEEETTNNRMELVALLRAVEWARHYPTIPVTIWSDSQYCVKGANDWRHRWKARGWRRGGDNAEPKNQILQNSDLWREIDAALSGPRASNISISWIKGHAGHRWNERADELAALGRASLQHFGAQGEDLDAEYRAVMAG